MCYGREFCGRPDRHPYELFLQLEGIEHRKTRLKRPQSNGIVERFHRTLLDEHFRVEGRRTWFKTIEERLAKSPREGQLLIGRDSPYASSA